jgi:predicted nuclease of predicted toxin-antitoxin system
VKVKLDENLPASLAEVLIADGHEVDTVLTEGLGGRDDPEIAAAARADERLLLTLDKGFADIRTYPPGTHPGMLVLRLPDESAASVRAAVTELVAHHRLAELAGTVTVLQHGRLRIRFP